MHSPSMLTSHVAAEIIGSHAEAARIRATRRQGAGTFGRFRRRSDASRPFMPRGQTSPRIAG